MRVYSGDQRKWMKEDERKKNRDVKVEVKGSSP